MNVSEAIVPFRETIILPPQLDMVNEVIEERHHVTKTQTKDDNEQEEDEEVLGEGLVQIRTPNQKCTLTIRAIPLPKEVVTLLESNLTLITAFTQNFTARISEKVDSHNISLTAEAIASLRELRQNMEEAFTEAGDRWNGAVDQIWSFGPKKNGPNVLLNRVEGYNRPIIWSCLEKSVNHQTGHLREYDSAIVNGFQMATLSGPLCEEPMMGVCFVVEGWDYTDQGQADNDAKPTSAALSDQSKSATQEDKGATQEDKGATQEDKGAAQGDKSAAQGDKGAAQGDKSAVHGDKSATQEDKGAAQGDKGASNEDESVSKTKDGDSDLSEDDEKDLKSDDEEKEKKSEPTVRQKSWGPLSGQLMSSMRMCCRRAFQTQHQRLMWAMYTCGIQCTAEVLGKDCQSNN